MVENAEIEISIIIPCLNEVRTLPNCIVKAKQALADNDLKGEIVVADNGSTDGSKDVALELGVTLIEIEVKGYGSALMGGIASARGKYILMGDADGSYDFSQLWPFVQKLRAGYDLVMGCRLPKGGGKIMPGAMPWKHRWIGNPVLTFIGRLFFKPPVSDFHCGLRAFTKQAYENMDLQTTGMEFASEMVVKASLKEMSIAEVPIILYKDGRLGKSHLRSWSDGWRHLRFMLLYSPRWLFFIPGLALMLVGGISGTVLTITPIKIGPITFDTNTLLVSAISILIGFQLLAFALFTKMFALAEGLLPGDRKTKKIMDSVSLEAGLAVGIVCNIVGFGTLVYALWYWRIHHFGALSSSDSLRIIIPGITILTLGVEITFASFFLSILRLRRR